MSETQPDPTLERFKPIAERLLSEGKSPDEVARFFRTHLALKQKAFYKRPSINNIGCAMKKVVSTIQGSIGSADSKAEIIFYDMLKEKGIKFDFQRSIGPYRVDYLIEGFLVCELDGPIHNSQRTHDRHRDSYLKRLGYQIKRIPLFHLINNSECVLEEIIGLIDRAKPKKKGKKRIKNQEAI